ncbi:eukaryotic translation initiation factor 4E [Rhizina undulata]
MTTEAPAAATTVDAILDEQRPLSELPVSPPNGIETDDIEDKEKDGDEEAGGEQELLTVFHSQEHFTVKHPLMNKWTLWFTKPPTTKGGDNWQDCLKEVVTFDSVEEFWGVYNNITKTSDLAIRSDYHLFKAGVRPEWEDSQNKNGGRWAYQFKEKRTIPIDELWLHVMLAAIGETLEPEGVKEVMGVVVNIRKGFFRIGLWTRISIGGGRGGGNGKNRETLMEIGKRFKEVLRLNDKEQVEFSGHTESAQSGSTRAKAMLVV